MLERCSDRRPCVVIPTSLRRLRRVTAVIVNRT